MTWLRHRPKRVVLDNYDSYDYKRSNKIGLRWWLKRFLVLLLIIAAGISSSLWHSAQADAKEEQRSNTLGSLSAHCSAIEHTEYNNKKVLIGLNLNNGDTKTSSHHLERRLGVSVGDAVE